MGLAKCLFYTLMLFSEANADEFDELALSSFFESAKSDQTRLKDQFSFSREA